jgi:hypothetical protein
VYLLEKTSPKTPGNKEVTLPLGFRIKVNQPIAAVDSTTDEKLSLKRAIKSDWPRAKGVRTLVESPPLAMCQPPCGYGGKWVKVGLRLGY